MKRFSSFLLCIFLYHFSATASVNDNWDNRFQFPGVEGFIMSAAYNGQEVIAAGSFSNITGTRKSPYLARFDGKVWLPFTDTANVAGAFFYKLQQHNGMLYACTSRGLFSYNNGWTSVVNTAGQAVCDLDWDASGNLYITGWFTSVNSIPANGIAKRTGNNWAAMAGGIDGAGSGSYGQYIAVVGSQVFISGNFSTVDGGWMAEGFAYWNGTHWRPLTLPNNTTFDNGVLLSYNTELYYAGAYHINGTNMGQAVYKWNPSSTTLTKLGSDFDSPVHQLQFHNNKLYAAGSFSTIGGVTADRVASYSGSSWINEGNGLTIEVYTLVFTPAYELATGTNNGTLYPYNYHNAAIRKGNTWVPTGLGLNGNVNAIEKHGNRIYVGGSFTEAGGMQVSRVASWDGQQWDSLTGGMILNTVNDLIFYRDTLYAGGDFTEPGTLAPYYVIRWNGTHWEPVSGGPNYRVYCLETYNNELYVGGEFSAIGSGPANNIVKYNGTWTPIGGVTNGTVKDIRFDSQGNLYAGGVFTTIGGVQARHIAKFNGSIWSELGSGVDNTVNAIAISSTDEVYIGGQFYLGYNVGIFNHVAKFNGTSLQAVGGGVGDFSSSVFSMRFHCNDLYIGGLFRTAGTDTVNNIVKWNGIWNTVGSGLTHDTTAQAYVLALAFDNNELWIGGNFAYAGGIRSDKIAAFATEGIPVISLSAVNNNACTGDTLQFTTAVSNAGLMPQYQWYVNNTPAGNGTDFSSASLNNGDEVHVAIINNPTCGNPDTIASETIVVVLSGLTVPQVSANGSTYTVTNPDAGAVYSWEVYNGSAWVPTGLSGLTFIAPQPGMYRVVADKNGCIKASSSFTITGLNVPGAVEINLYPNPAHNELFIEHAPANSVFTLFDLKGQVLLEQAGSSPERQTINVEGLNNGLYLLRIQSENHVGYTKIVVQSSSTH